MIQLHVVLVRTIYDQNIGGVSRAITNMGGHQLILVDPQCPKDSLGARQGAASGQDPLTAAKVYKDWEEFLDQEEERAGLQRGLRLGFTARGGKSRPVQTLDSDGGLLELSALIEKTSKERGTPIDPLYLIFGPEDAGLSAEDLKWCHRLYRLPTPGKNSSLNLAQAVLLALFILRTHFPLPNEDPNLIHPLSPNNEDVLSASPHGEVFPETSLRDWLIELGFDLSKSHGGSGNALTTLRRLLLSQIPSPKELRVLEAVFHQGRRKLQEYNTHRKRLTQQKVPVHILVTGGTFDKEYDEINGRLFFKDTHVEEMLRRGRSLTPTTIQTLMMMDSLDMTDKDRQIILDHCRQIPSQNLVITHGTDTMVETARILGRAQLGKTIVLTGAMVPYKFGSSDGLFNLSSALALVQTLPPDVYCAMNGRWFHWTNVEKDKASGIFRETHSSWNEI